MRRIILIATAILAVACGSAGAHPASQAKSGGLSWSGYSWHLHSGTGALGQQWSPSHVSVVGGHLVIKLSGGVGGGVAMATDKHFGTWTVTYRMSTGGGKYAILLWPQNGNRPEVDFAEDKPTDSQRKLMTATFHPKPGCTNCIHAQASGNFTAWHTVSVKWSATGYALSLDGRVWQHFPSAGYGGASHLSIQTAAWGNNAPSTLEVASVHVS
jgi:hypothetical protein